MGRVGRKDQRGEAQLAISSQRAIYSRSRTTSLAIAPRDTLEIEAVDPEVGEELRVAEPALRRALARELHDRVAQTLTALLIDLEQFKAEQVGRQTVLHKVDSVQGSMREVLSSLRELLYDLRGDGVAASGDLRESLAKLIGDFERRTGIISTLTIHPRWPGGIGSAAASNLYRIVEESLSNAERHSGARQVAVSLRVAPGDGYRVTITDDGRGYDRQKTLAGMGTVGMEERAVVIGARLSIDSFPGYGTAVHITLPGRVFRGVVAEG
jgi:two-component system sensor histidine kinase UhpB